MSKANQAFNQNDEAVSPVIGVILMVAITVVLAAVVFVLVSNLGKGSESAPSFSLTRDDNSDRLTVAQADSSGDWNRLAIKTSQAGVEVVLNADSPATCTAGGANSCNALVANTNAEITDAANPMTAGEFLELCDASTQQVTVTIIDGVANQQIGSFTFTDLQACP
jgi:flagellin-like protein